MKDSFDLENRIKMQIRILKEGFDEMQNKPDFDIYEYGSELFESIKNMVGEVNNEIACQKARYSIENTSSSDNDELVCFIQQTMQLHSKQETAKELYQYVVEHPNLDSEVFGLIYCKMLILDVPFYLSKLEKIIDERYDSNKNNEICEEEDEF